jgi:hypothetical protein
MNIRNLAVACVVGSSILAAATPSLAEKTAAVAAAPAASAEHARFGTAVANTGAPALQTTVDMIAAGSDKTGFQSTTLVSHLAGALTATELASLTKQFGADNVVSFVKTFNFVITDAVAKVTAAEVPLPKASTPEPDGKALSAELYILGVTPDKSFDVEYMLDALVTHGIHTAVMDDIDKDPAMGPKADANYHAVLTQAMKDLKGDYKL